MMTVGYLAGYKVAIHGKIRPEGNRLTWAGRQTQTVFGWVCASDDPARPFALYVKGKRATLWRAYTVLDDIMPADVIAHMIELSRGIPRRLWQ